MSNGYGAYGSGGNTHGEWGEHGTVAEPQEPLERDGVEGPRSHGEFVKEWGVVGHYLAPPPTPGVLRDPPPAALYSADPGNGQPHIPWINVDYLGNLYVYGNLVAGSGKNTVVTPSGDTTGATDTAAIQALLNIPGNSATVTLAPGKFYINTTILLDKSNQSIIGAGPAVSRLLIATSFTPGTLQSNLFLQAPVIQVGANGGQAASCYLSGFSIEGISGTIANNPAANAINLWKSSQCQFSNLQFDNINGWCFEDCQDGLSGGNNVRTLFGNVVAYNNAGCIHMYGSNKTQGVLYYNIESGNGPVTTGPAVNLPGFLCEETDDIQLVNCNFGAAGSSTASNAVLNGGVSAFWWNGFDLGDGGVNAYCIQLTQTVNGNPVRCTFDNGSVGGVDIEGSGTQDITFRNTAFDSSRTSGLIVNSGGPNIRILDSMFGSTGIFYNGQSVTTVAAGSSGGEISAIASWASPSAGVLDVASAGNFSSTGGTAYVAASGSTIAEITYTGTATGQLTGCAYVSGSPTGTVLTGAVTESATNTNYDINWTGASTGLVSRCYLNSKVEAVGSQGVQASVNVAALQAVRFDNVSFTGSNTSRSNAFTAVPVSVHNSNGFNPFGAVTVSVPSSASATTALGYDSTFYVTAGAGGSTVIVVSSGGSITVPASAVVAVFVPAGLTVTPTYSSAPTWVVVGN